MHNGCLLLLAFVAVFQPIASYTEPGLVNGRQQRCDYRTSVRDPGLNFHGTYRFAKPAVEERRLNNREDIREVRRNEVREGSLRTASSADRRLADIVGRDRNTLKRSSIDRVTSDAVLRRETREVRLSGYRDDRIRESSRDRQARVHISQARSPSRQESRLSEDANRSQRIDNRRSDERRLSVESRRDTQRNGNEAELRRVRGSQAIRLTTNRVRDNVESRLLTGRRLTTEGDQRMESQRLASRMQSDRNANRDVLDRRSRNREVRDSSTPSNRVDRVYSNEGSRMDSRVETSPLDRENRQTSSSRRSVDERRQLRDVTQSRRTAEQRYNRESVNSRNLRDLSSENRRDPQLTERARSTESRRENRETESKARLVRAVRSVDSRVSQDDRSGSRVSQRLRSAESRRGVRDTRSMERMGSLDRSTEYRKVSRSVDRARLLESRNIRDSRESRTMNNVRAAETLGDIRNVDRDSPLIQLNLKRTTELRRASRDGNTCALNREPSSELRMTRIQITRERSQENRRDTRNVNSRPFDTERAEQNRRSARSYPKTRVFRAERTEESRRDSRDIRRNLESRSFRTERTAESRQDHHNLESRVFRTERSVQIRGNARNGESRLSRTERNENSRNGFRAFKTERTIDSRRNIRGSEMKSVSLDRAIEYRRDNRNNERDIRKYDRTVENRQHIRNTEDERVSITRRVARLQRDTRSVSRQSSMESHLNERMATRDSRISTLENRSEDRRERSTENRFDTRSISKELRTLDSQGDRRVESRRINLVKSRDDVSRRNNERATERMNKRDSLHNSHSRYTAQRESRNMDTQRTSERDNLDTRQREAESLNFARKREFQSMFRNPSQAENEPTTMNWQYIFNTIQALYICGMLMQFNKGSTDKKTRASWWSAPQRLIKVE